ncbi:sarcosine oxidase subunit gamma family protein [Aminobacter sp. AP02]|uniref:sarcosine oxidase subunit gamma n=1 Tax=Aminobacter sp. AP02 TaxID=2135737 RepID=UPI000D6C2657|nr:sarcosine oxidase subunit gamma family protein [Aminobacter sp. AP02]PWK76908.1 N-methylglutamate dehydrogenase subunit D [Aminobacter sp. AP02]
MVDYLWNTQSPLQKALVPGCHGATGAHPGVTLREVRDIVLVQVMARRGKAAETAKAAKKLFGVEAPATPKAVIGKTATLVWSGPDQFTVIAPRTDEASQLAAMAQAFTGSASLSDQSDGRCLIRVSGARARDAIAKFSSLDLHDSVFPVGTAANTSVDHTAVNFWREANGTDGHPVYNMLVFTSFSDSLWHTIVDSSLEYGVEASSAKAA